MTFKTLLLNNRAIEHFSYHWFFGLRYSERAKSDSRNHLSLNISMAPPQLTKLREQSQSVAKRNSIVRFFMWFFNINNYAKNAYILAAIDAKAALENSMFKSRNENPNQTTYLISNAEVDGVAPSTTWVERRMLALLKHHRIVPEVITPDVVFPPSPMRDLSTPPRDEHWTPPSSFQTPAQQITFSGQRAKSMPLRPLRRWHEESSSDDEKSTTSSSSEPRTPMNVQQQFWQLTFCNQTLRDNSPEAKQLDTLPTEEAYLIVNTTVQQLAQTLGLSCELGSQLAYRTFKDQFNNLAYQLHPDKTNNDAEKNTQFKLVHTAYTQLQRLLLKTVHHHDEPESDVVVSFWTEQGEIANRDNIEKERERARLLKIAEENRIMAQKIEALRREIAASNSGYSSGSGYETEDDERADPHTTLSMKK